MQELPEPLPEPAPWYPRSLAVPGKKAFSRGNSLLFAAIIVGHAAALFLLARAMQAQRADEEQEVVTEVSFVARPLEAEPVRERAPEMNKKQIPPAQRARPRLQSPQPHSPNTPQALDAIGGRKSRDLFDDTGHVKLPEGLMDDLDARYGDKRVFDYQVPGLATASKAFDRPPPLSYEHNDFEDYYQPDQTLLNEVLTKMVEGTTAEVRIKIPGNPRAKIVCAVSLLALGGGCAVVQNQGNYVIEDDPETLSDEEQEQCRAWWDKIVDTRSQDVWRKTRDLYDSECRKPLEHKSLEVPGLEPMPGRIQH